MYYGDELGMEDVFVPRERLQDPVALRKPDTDEGRDPERAPMPWDANPNAGFTPAGVLPWLPIPENYCRINVAAQQNDPASTLNFYKRLLHLRRELPALHLGDIAFLEGMPRDILAYRRSTEGQRVLVLINFGKQAEILNLSSQGMRAELLLSTHGRPTGKVSLDRLEIGPHEGYLLRS